MSTVFVSKHEVFYSNRLYVPITEIADSLLAFERIVRHCQPVFAKVVPDCDAFDIRLELESLQSGSLRDTFLVKFVFGSEEAYDRWIRRIRELTGVQELTHRCPVVGPILVGAVLTGAIYAVTRMAVRDSSIPGTSISIQNVSNSVISLGANSLNIPPEQLRAALAHHTGNSFNLASNACKFIRPAKSGDGAASITMDGNEELKIGSEAVRETPMRVERTPGEPRVQVLSNAIIHVRALDLDSPKKGWAVVIPEVSERRIRLEIDSSVDRSRLLHSGPHQAEIEVYFRETAPGEEVPIHAFLRALRDPALTGDRSDQPEQKSE